MAVQQRESRNLWRFISSHDLIDFIQINKPGINRIFLDSSYDIVTRNNFIINITDIKVKPSRYGHGGFYINIQILDNNRNNIFNDLHVSMHSETSDSSQSHITTQDKLGPTNRINLNFSTRRDNNMMNVFIEKYDEIDTFLKIHNISTKYNDEQIQVIKFILNHIIPNGISNILNAMNRQLTSITDLERSQSFMHSDMVSGIVTDIQQLLYQEEELIRRQEILQTRLQQLVSRRQEVSTRGHQLVQQKNDFELSLQSYQGRSVVDPRLEPIINNLRTDIAHLEQENQQLEQEIQRLEQENVQINMDLSGIRINIQTLNNRITSGTSEPVHYTKKYLKYKQKYLKLKKQIDGK